MARLLADEHFPMRSVNRLRRLGHDVSTVRQASESKSGDAMPDELVAEIAQNERRIILTMNVKHFLKLHKEHPGHPGIIGCSHDKQPIRLAKRIDMELRSRRGRCTGQFIRLHRPQKN